MKRELCQGLSLLTCAFWALVPSALAAVDPLSGWPDPESDETNPEKILSDLERDLTSNRLPQIGSSTNAAILQSLSEIILVVDMLPPKQDANAYGKSLNVAVKSMVERDAVRRLTAAGLKVNLQKNVDYSKPLAMPVLNLDLTHNNRLELKESIVLPRLPGKVWVVDTWIKQQPEVNHFTANELINTFVADYLIANPLKR